MCIPEEKQSGEGIRFAVLSLCLLAARTGLDELEGGSSWRESMALVYLRDIICPATHRMDAWGDGGHSLSSGLLDTYKLGLTPPLIPSSPPAAAC